MLGFYLVNLLPPGRPIQFQLNTPSGVWDLQQVPNFQQVEPDILKKGACANTYSMTFAPPGVTTQDATALDETIPICLASSFVTGAAVTIRHSLPGSQVQFVRVGSHYPRERGIGDPAACVNTLAECTAFIERFVAEYLRLDPVEKLRLMMHFFVDGTACWSLENLYLSGSTLLQIIADTEKSSGRIFAKTNARLRNSKIGFFDYLAGAANRVGIAPLAYDVVSIRNSLIHDGTLRSTTIKTQADAAIQIAEAMRWFEGYLYAILRLGAVPKDRYTTNLLAYGLNSFSF